MQTWTRWLIPLLTPAWILATSVATGQDISLQNSPVPLPLYSTRPDGGRFFVSPEIIVLKQNNPPESPVLTCLLDSADTAPATLLCNANLQNPSGTPSLRPPLSLLCFPLESWRP
jgi:hypothetical protein